MNQSSKIYRIRPGYILRNFLEECIVVPVSAAEGAGRNLSILDPVGEFIWRRLEGPGSSFQEVLEAVLEEFDVDRDTASRDIREFLCELQNNQYLSDEREEQQ